MKFCVVCLLQLSAGLALACCLLVSPLHAVHDSGDIIYGDLYRIAMLDTATHVGPKSKMHSDTAAAHCNPACAVKSEDCFQVSDCLTRM